MATWSEFREHDEAGREVDPRELIVRPTRDDTFVRGMSEAVGGAAPPPP